MTKINHSYVQYKTYLPVATVEHATQYAPQYDAVTWAFAQGRKALRGEPTTAVIVLVAYAQHALASLVSDNGYAFTTPEQVASLTGLSVSTVKRYVKVLAAKGLLNDHSYLSGQRVAEEALDASWVA